MNIVLIVIVSAVLVVLLIDIAEHRLVDLAASGSAIRSAAEIERLAAFAGWTLTRRASLGWNYEVFELSR